MQKLIKSIILTAISLYLTTLIIPGFSIQSGITNIIIATLVLGLLNVIVRPVVKLLLLPVNLVTLGAFRWLANIILLYLLTFLMPEVNIQGFFLSSIPGLGVILPHVQVGRFIATILVSIVLSTSEGFLMWVIK